MMSIPTAWRDPPDLRAATAIQREIAAACEPRDRLGRVRVIAGADTSNKWRDARGPIHAAIAPLAWPRAAALAGASASATRIPPFPYVPGYLGFREAPALIAAWEALAEKPDLLPDLLFVDGHGRAHPRRCGIATHLGVLLDVATIGVAKSLLCGALDGELGPAPGDSVPVVDRGEVVAIALRLRARAAPVYVGVGHRVSLETAVGWVRAVSDGRRLPPPIRAAHDAANATRRAWQAARPA